MHRANYSLQATLNKITCLTLPNITYFPDHNENKGLKTYLASKIKLYGIAHVLKKGLHILVFLDLTKFICRFRTKILILFLFEIF